MRKSLLRGIDRIAARGGIIICFIVAFEVMIMISPFAFFFYSVFNPFLHWLDNYTATRWLTAFFLPHMILPPTIFLKGVRILGSILFVAGSVTFAVCALQVYLGKLFRWGIAARGLYSRIRHPQYLALELWGIGMSILWPRFLVLASLSLMLILYYFLAEEEERRMLRKFGEGYRKYMNHTGMFLPRLLEARLSAPFEYLRGSALKQITITFCMPIVIIGTGFILRGVTLSSLPIQTSRNITLVSILPEDDVLSSKVLREVIGGTASSPPLSLLKADDDYLGYVMPPDYVMQGMIANTGEAFHLHQHHNTFALIADWIFNPFEHLRRSPSALMAAIHRADPLMARRHHCPISVNDPNLQCDTCPMRRIIFLRIENNENVHHLSRTELFSLDAKRLPICFMDVNTRTGEIVNMESVGAATAWVDVPTPAI